MAKLIQAISLYSPKVKKGSLVGVQELAEFLAQRTSMKTGEAKAFMSELAEGIIFYTKSGRSVKLENIGVFSPSVDLSGDFNISYRQDSKLATALDHGQFRGEITNRDKMGLTSSDLKELWNKEHPDDPIP